MGGLTMRWAAGALGLMIGAMSAAHAAVPPPDSPAAKAEAQKLDQLPAVVPRGKAPIDHSGRRQKGRASYYSQKFAHRKMADGKRMDPHADMAASKSLPLGTTAKVTNLQNGRTATVRVEDRGPYIDGRVVDVTPKVAADLGLKKPGVVPVEVRPIAVPQPNGEVKLGAGAADASPEEARQATATTQALTARPSAERTSSR